MKLTDAQILRATQRAAKCFGFRQVSGPHDPPFGHVEAEVHELAHYVTLFGFTARPLVMASKRLRLTGLDTYTGEVLRQRYSMRGRDLNEAEAVVVTYHVLRRFERTVPLRELGEVALDGVEFAEKFKQTLKQRRRSRRLARLAERLGLLIEDLAL